MSDYDAEYEQRLINEYNRLANEYNRLAEENARLAVEVEGCQRDVASSINIVEQLNDIVLPPMDVNTGETIKKEVIAANVSRTIDDLVESYRQLKTGSTASKNLSGSYDKYYTLYGTYNALRQVSLGYVVGLDTNLWTSDAPRQKVEEMYLANTDYWLAYATMAVMLWASNEKEACERAVSKSMQMNEKKSALFFLLVSLRFNKINAAKRWYKVYFKLVDENGIGDEIIYILQALLSGVMGKEDPEFYNEVVEKMNSLISESRKLASTTKLVRESINNHIDAIISVTDKEYIDLKHICPEYNDMINLVSSAEKNEMLRQYFLKIIHSDFSLSDRLSERIEDTLYSLISTYDDNEQALMDKISYEEAIVKANGKIEVAEEAYKKMMAERDNQSNMALIMTDAALDPKMKTDCRVRKYCLDSIKDDCIAEVKRFGNYRSKEKKSYPLNVDGYKLSGDENSFEENKPKLLKYYDGIIKKAVKEDKSNITCGKVLGGAVALLILFTILSVVGFISNWHTGISVTLLVLAVVALGIAVFAAIMKVDQGKKIKQAYQYRIQNGIKMLKTGLEDMARWRQYYKEQNAIFEEVIRVLKEEI